MRVPPGSCSLYGEYPDLAICGSEKVHCATDDIPHVNVPDSASLTASMPEAQLSGTLKSQLPSLRATAQDMAGRDEGPGTLIEPSAPLTGKA